jgi:hypothetical protein
LFAKGILSKEEKKSINLVNVDEKAPSSHPKKAVTHSQIGQTKK